jgi:membrane protein required for colicin V production
MTIVDTVIVGAIVLSAAIAASQGFFYEVFRLAGVVFGYLVAVWEYPWLARWYAQFVKTDWAANIAAFFTIFVAIVLLAGIVGRLARWSVREVGLRWFDRILGGAFGVLRGVLLVTVVLVGASAWTPNASWLARSQFAPYLLILGRAAVWVAPGEIRRQFRDGLKQLQHWPAPPGAPAGGK